MLRKRPLQLQAKHRRRAFDFVARKLMGGVNNGDDALVRIQSSELHDRGNWPRVGMIASRIETTMDKGEKLIAHGVKG